MAEVVSSAIVHEAVNKIISGLVDKYEHKSSAEEQMERLEMAHIKLETALDTSSKWQITSGPLLRWQKKLKRAAEECDDIMRKCRQRVQEEEAEQQVRNSSFPRRIAHATKSLISSIFNGNSNEPVRSSVRRFEWFADGANDFLRYVEFGGTPRRYLFFDPLIGNLFAGETLEYKLVQGNRQHLLWIIPNITAERGVEAKLILVYNDARAPVDNFFLGMMLQLSESTNIVGTTIKCLQLFTTHFKSTTETVKKELTQLPTQDFSWIPRSSSYGWDNIHNLFAQWFRPNPLCCKHHGEKVCGSRNMDKVELPAVSLEPLIEVGLLCQVSLPGFKEPGTIVEDKSSIEEYQHLNVHLVYTPHGSSEDLCPAVKSTVIEVINGFNPRLDSEREGSTVRRSSIAVAPAMKAGIINKNIVMSEVVASAVVSEAVSRISTLFINKHKRKLTVEDGMERLEMAHIRMEAALEMSSKWPPVTDTLLLHWRKKLKQASNECGHVLDRCKRRAMEDDEIQQEVKRHAFPKRIAHATRSFFSSFTGHKNDDSLITTSTIQRFERFADGAGEFLRFMEFGSIGRINYMLVDPLSGHLLAGKALQYGTSHGNQYHLAAWPMRFPERGLEAGFLLRYQNHERPEENFIIGILLRLATSTNVAEIVARCLELLPPNFKPVAEAAKQELTQVHQRGFYCFPFVDSTDPEYWRTHHDETHCARPNATCCQGREDQVHCTSSDVVEPSRKFPEPVIKLIVQRYVSAQQGPSSSSGHGSRKTPLLQLTAIIVPHSSPEDLPPEAQSIAIVAVDGREEQGVHTNVELREVEDFLLPNTIDRMCHEVADGSSTHEVFWQSGHGATYLHVEKTGTEIAGRRPTRWPCKCGRLWRHRAQLWCRGRDGVVAGGAGCAGGGERERPTIEQ
uniref:Disease resistance N-terminal domain-containing protein n=1 Tax=Leersia perrieri TaxID=77586 RepID=A0A0D9WV09_9ORYZ